MKKLICAWIASIVMLSDASAAQTKADLLAFPGCGTGTACKTLSGNGATQRGTVKTATLKAPGSGLAVLTAHAILSCVGPKGASVQLALRFTDRKTEYPGLLDGAVGNGSTLLFSQNEEGYFEIQQLTMTNYFRFAQISKSTSITYTFKAPSGTSCSIFGGDISGTYTPENLPE